MRGEVKYISTSYARPCLGRQGQRGGEAWEQCDSCGAWGRGSALQGTALGKSEEQLVIAEEEPQPLSVDEAELELLRQFDLAWQYGPCTGENPSGPRSTPQS